MALLTCVGDGVALEVGQLEEGKVAARVGAAVLLDAQLVGLPLVSAEEPASPRVGGERRRP